MRQKKQPKNAIFRVHSDLLKPEVEAASVMREIAALHSVPCELLEVKDVLRFRDSDYLRDVGNAAADLIAEKVAAWIGSGAAPVVRFDSGFDDYIDFAIDYASGENFVRACNNAKTDAIEEIQDIARYAIDMASMNFFIADYFNLTDEAEFLFEKSKNRFEIVAEFNRLKKQGKDYIEAMHFSDRSKMLVAEAMTKITDEFRGLLKTEMENAFEQCA